ncbi:unnamed protein product [Hymenolepis diminuta]|uniref:Cytochrome c oxidase assembly protein COX11, mitochondrial n=1 Tax=Hymenolepis diminuta TaxID=6216 RepID=A0A0R3SQ03_HYMDI|nr:unnamed protein product [Hymenolepis diminuta]VUZ52425.1 unnamed protein product [Hymenolepis diminuta]
MPSWLKLSPLCRQFVRPLYQANRDFDRKTGLYYSTAAGIFMLGLGYAGVPLYRIYCAKTGRGSNTEGARIEVSDFIALMKPVRERRVTIEFSADTYSHMAWNFKPSQNSLIVVPGETALAFYTAKNPTSKPIIGIATYTVLPIEAAKYFNKIQCFCFEEQRLNPGEEVDLPVFFFLDPEFDDDPHLMRTNKITLHYTFFEAKKEKLMVPGISKPILEDVG